MADKNYIPDPKLHLAISLVKSALRIIAGLFLANQSFILAGTLFILAETLGIIEEIV